MSKALLTISTRAMIQQHMTCLLTFDDGTAVVLPLKEISEDYAGVIHVGFMGIVDRERKAKRYDCFFMSYGLFNGTEEIGNRGTKFAVLVGLLDHDIDAMKHILARNKGMTIIVNGKPTVVKESILRYEDLANRAGLTVTYRGEHVQGELKKGQSIPIENGMVFNVADTGVA